MKATVRAESVSRKRDALAAWLGCPSGQVLSSASVLLFATRAWIGSFAIIDAVVVLAVVFTWPLVEWFVHARLSHAEPPHALFGLPLSFRSRHARHHQDPGDSEYILLDLVAALAYIGGSVGLFVAVVGLASLLVDFAVLSPVVSGTLASLVVLARYEWVHFLTHTTYTPQSKRFMALRVRHLNHHAGVKPDRFSVTTFAGDWLFGRLGRSAGGRLDRST